MLSPQAQRQLAPFIRHIIPESELARFIDPGGSLNDDGIRYVTTGLEFLASGANDTGVQNVFFSDISSALDFAASNHSIETVRFIDQMTRALPRLFKLRLDAAAGKIDPKYHIAYRAASAANGVS